MPEKDSSRRKLTGEKERDLDVRISFMEGLLRRDPGCVEALQVLGDDYTRRGRFIESLKVDEQLSQLLPSDPQIQYNLACSHSLNGNFDQAASALDRALDFGYRDLKWLSQDACLSDLRAHPVFRGIRAKIRGMKMNES